jgi:hypothetical protein
MQIDCIGSPLGSKASNNVRSVRCSVRCKENLCSTVQTKDLENPLSSNGTGTENRSRTTPSGHERLQVAAFGKPDFFSAVLAASTTIRLTVFQSKSFGTISFACKLRVKKVNINVKQKGHYSIAVMTVKAYCQVLNLSPLGLDSPLGVWGMLLAQALGV